MLESGAKVGRYEIQERLGRGGMGFVFRAKDSDLHRVVALKVLREDDVEPGELTNARERFLREARAAAALDHPNVVTIFDVGVHGETPYLVMELVRGRTLREAMKGDATTAERIDWLAQVAKALAAAHEVGLVHRDIKPDNVIVGDDGVVKVLDFGLAKPINPRAGFTFETLDDHALGTPKYMAPEQLVGARVDAKADQYAWGRTAFEVLTRILPAPPQELPRLDEAAPGVSARLADLVERTQAKLPSGRMPDMTTIVSVLESLSSDTSSARAVDTVTLPETPAEEAPEVDAPRPSKPRRHREIRPDRKRWPIFVAAAAPGVVFGGIVVALVTAKGGRDQPALATSSSNTTPVTIAPSPSPSPSPSAIPTELDAGRELTATGTARAVSSTSTSTKITAGCACREKRVYGLFGGAMCTTEQDGPCRCVGPVGGEAFPSELCQIATDETGSCAADKYQFVVGKKTGDACEGYRDSGGRAERVAGRLSCNRCVQPERIPGKTTGAPCRGVPLGADRLEDGVWDCAFDLPKQH